MRISGYGEFQQVRKLSQKDDASVKERAEREEQEVLASDSDSVKISPETMRKMKLRQASDFREAKVADVRSRYEAGTLVTQDALESGTRKILDAMVSGDL